MRIVRPQDPDEYEFGDATRKLLGDTDRALASARDAYLAELPGALWRQTFAGLSENQRRDLFLSLAQLMAAALLCLSAVINMTLACTISVAWTVTCSSTGVSPLASFAGWSRFLSTLATLRLAIDPPLLPLRCLAALVLLPRYRNATKGLQRVLPMSERYILLNNALAFAAAWLLINVLGSAAIACVGVGMASIATGVPLFCA